MKNSLLFYLLFLFPVLQACESDQRPGRTSSPKKERLAAIKAPKNGARFKEGEQVAIEIVFKKPDLIDSVLVELDGHIIQRLEKPKSTQLSFELSPADISLGIHRISYNLWSKGEQESRLARILYLPAQAAAEYGFEILNAYPHDKSAYTQGLIIHDGRLYEGTGQRGASQLRELSLQTAEVIRSTNLPESVFGEGICYWNGHIYQLSWTSQAAFQYDINSFEIQKTFSYNGEGWGLCDRGDTLYMSDGSNIIRLLNPRDFNQIATLEVFDHRGPVRNLNELEFINGEIWANVYQSMKIARIDPETGAVNSYINLRGILDRSDIHQDIDVLNGIAFNRETGSIYVTGKNWPKLFEIAVSPLQ